MAILNQGGQRTLQVQSQNYTETSAITRQDLLNMCEKYPILYQLLKVKMHFQYDDSTQMFLRQTLKQVNFLKKAHWKTIA